MTYLPACAINFREHSYGYRSVSVGVCAIFIKFYFGWLLPAAAIVMAGLLV
ncbi:hypothetical protein GWO68_09980 [Pontibacter sp. BT213]|uniref:Uncharacterized protein n=1 Tax=Pontibacter fetidus TaxID=2700082 RepID=A0A6B2GZF6_9BACT|nr:hypothetical protein [Pontibacter fetidus]